LLRLVRRRRKGPSEARCDVLHLGVTKTFIVEVELVWLKNELLIDQDLWHLWLDGREVTLRGNISHPPKEKRNE